MLAAKSLPFEHAMYVLVYSLLMSSKTRLGLLLRLSNGNTPKSLPMFFRQRQAAPADQKPDLQHLPSTELAFRHGSIPEHEDKAESSFDTDPDV